MDRDLLGYVVARRLRVLLGEERFARLGRIVPRFRLEPVQALDPFTVVDAAVLQLTRQGLTIPGASLLVVGCGPTNGAGYALAALGAARAVCHDPRPGFDVNADAKHLAAMTTMHPKVKYATSVARAARLADIPDAFCDAVIVEPAGPGDLRELAATLRRLLRPGGVVVTRVDFREPLSRYPYHRLLLSGRVGKRRPAPGERGPWRCDDHIAALTAAGFDVTVPFYESDLEAFALVADRLHPDYRDRDHGLLAVTRATLVGCLRRPGEALPPLDSSAGGATIPWPPRTPSTDDK
jgi:SAM-dependent methyltransferase